MNGNSMEGKLNAQICLSMTYLISCNVILGYLVGPVLENDSSELAHHAWNPRRQLNGEDIIRKRKSEVLFSPSHLTFTQAIT